MISIEEVLKIHNILIEKFGGIPGLRDRNLLESAINRPYQTFDGQELYPTTEEKAAVIFESIVKNHPFTDGNKRTGYTIMRLLLMKGDKDIEASEDEKYNLVINVAEGKMKIDEILDWIQLKIINKS